MNDLVDRLVAARADYRKHVGEGPEHPCSLWLNVDTGDWCFVLGSKDMPKRRDTFESAAGGLLAKLNLAVAEKAEKKRRKA